MLKTEVENHRELYAALKAMFPGGDVEFRYAVQKDGLRLPLIVFRIKDMTVTWLQGAECAEDFFHALRTGHLWTKEAMDEVLENLKPEILGVMNFLTQLTKS